ncbi:MAG TPA: hypothetical protein VGV67_11280 [Solirubrobacteraceae bacterium]|nr:hypothetical protein [Solirubrobacteraceae bacterium]
MTEPASVYRRRRATALALLAGVVVLLVMAVRSCGEEAADRVAEPESQAAAADRPPAELPRGGRRIFPDFRVVAFYGAPQSDKLGALGIGSPAAAGRRLERVARGYARRTRPVLPAFELISTIAAAAPGDDGLHRMHQPDEVISRYLDAARDARALLVLDIQPGRGDFVSEVRRLERWLREPDVGIALDPEWHVGPGEIPGNVIGSVTADEVNAVTDYLARFVVEHNLPEKLFVVHQFTSGMIENKDRVARRRGLAVTMNVDGFGDRPNKISKYVQFTSELARFHDGFKLFYEEDTNLMSPGAVLDLRPPPDLVVYE